MAPQSRLSYGYGPASASIRYPTVNELLRLTLLSPAVVKGLLAGRQPRTLRLIWLKNHEVPADRDEQKRLFDERDAHS